MRPSELLILSFCLVGMASCTTIQVQEDITYGCEPSLGFSGPQIQVNNIFYETSYYPNIKTDLNGAVDTETVDCLRAIGIICEQPQYSRRSLSGLCPPGILLDNKLELTLKTEDGGIVLGRQILRLGDVLLIPSGSTEPVFISRSWNPPKRAKVSKILSEFRRLIEDYQVSDYNKSNSEQDIASDR